MGWLDGAFKVTWRSMFALGLGALSAFAFIVFGVPFGKAAAFVSLLGAAFILIAQEDEADELRRELKSLATQLTQVLDGVAVDQRERGIQARLADRHKDMLRSRFKTVGVYLLILGAGYAMLAA